MLRCNIKIWQRNMSISRLKRVKSADVESQSIAGAARRSAARRIPLP